MIEPDHDVASLCGLHVTPRDAVWCEACAVAAKATRERLDEVIAEEGDHKRAQARMGRALRRRVADVSPGLSRVVLAD